MTRDTPPEWLAVMDPKRLRSARALATESKVSPSAITRLFHGEQTSEDTVIAVADALGLTEAEVWRLHGTPRTNPFRLGREADALSPTQRAAVKAVVTAMLEDKTEAATGTVTELRPAARGGRKPRRDESE